MSVHYRDAAAPKGMRIYAIGDVHGRRDLLDRMHELIAAEIERDRPADWRIIHLGDYVDRGPDSAGVVERLAHRTADDPRVLALVGNHDLGFLDFLAVPQQDGLFATHGGVDTARSYGVGLNVHDPVALTDGWTELEAAVPARHRDFLASLPFSLAFGDFFFCHAGIRPGVPLAQQAPDDLVWIRQEFHRWPHLHPKVVVHGHTPTHEPGIFGNRVNLDTGAWESGRLTALVIEGTEKRFLQATAGSAAIRPD
ncbi:serine/threonine protein phosphatase [Aquibium carbonis]|uniref:Serine/threonine protein phosphatase n=1 Tax=Aquibium carbonis TaxID=2495581 RepID=A0A429YUZ3_9HYPH|nr:metallophosphoesterase [Aquibium carbonis]RST85259.1 serine/threonine protein phosphatase [Aquibium carbonis]